MAYFLAQTQKLPTSLYDARKTWKPCKFFLKGNCRYGRDCKFLHDDAKPHKTCNFFLKGTCRNGPDCKFLHDSSGKLDQLDSGSIAGRRPNETAIPVPLYLGYVCGRGIWLHSEARKHNVNARVGKNVIYVEGSATNVEEFTGAVRERMSSMITYCLPVPDKISMLYIVGRQGSTLQGILHDNEEDTDTFCWPCKEHGRKEIKLVSSSQIKIDLVAEKIKMRLFTTTPVLDSVTCYDAKKSNVRLCFQPHTGDHFRTLGHRQQHTLKLSVRAQMPSPSKDSAESFLKKGLENLKLKPSIVFEDTSKATAAWSKTEKLPPSGLIHEDNLLFVRQCMLEKLKKLQTYQGQIRIEARMGKLLWTDVPPEIASSEYDILEFEGDIVPQLKSSFATYVSTSPEDVSEDLDEPTVLDTYDFKVSLRELRRLDLRVTKTDDGSLECYAAYKNEEKVFVANWVFLEGQHDVRLSLNTRELVSLDEPLIQQFTKSINIGANGRVSFKIIPGFRVHFIRHKVKSSYVIENKLCVAISKVDEFNGERPQYARALPGTRMTAEFSSSHYEIELQNLLWLAAFSSSSPKTSMVEFFEMLKCPVLSNLTPPEKPWIAEEIIGELPHFIDTLECVIESLKP
ncbi:uncharacterized protein [Oscarella lobularis]|uniref:uncharacterized protein isoform X2 n=1 Tax=Oscarella lobularis TaxID=121494 RepID=UPI00331363AD